MAAFSVNVTILPNLLLFLTDVNRGNPECQFMEMNIAETGIGYHLREFSL